MSEQDKVLLPPGSKEAREQGCNCPVIDNAHGRGRGKDHNGQTVYVKRGDCPLHGWEKKAEP